MLISIPALACFDVNTVTTDLCCDSSGGSIGAVLQQTDKDGEIRPVDYYSRKFTQPDLTTILKRCLAILSQFQMTEISHVTG